MLKSLYYVVTPGAFNIGLSFLESRVALDLSYTASDPIPAPDAGQSP